MCKPFKHALAFALAALCGHLCAAPSGGAEGVPAPFVAAPAQKELEKNVFETAKSALESGMASLARAIIQDNAARVPELKNSALIAGAHVDSLIAIGDFRDAAEPLKLLSPGEPENKLRAALVRAGLGKGRLAQESLSGIDPEKIPARLRSWLHLARGYALFESGDNAGAMAEFQRAKSSAKNPRARADAEIAVNICRLSAPAAANPAELEAELKQKTSVLMGTPEGFNFAKQYAALLFRRGRDAEAIDVINQQLEIALAPEIDKEELNLISAAYAKDPEKQMQILKSVLRKTSSPEIAEFSIELVCANNIADPRKTSEFLEDIFNSGSAKIKDRILLEIANSAIRAKDRRLATVSAQKLVEEYPQSRHKADALRILAWSAWENDPPQYRLAASNLAKLAALQESERARAEIMYLAAACYFRDKDFATAAEIYRDIFPKLAQKRGRILGRAVDSLLELGRESGARELIDEAYKNGSVEPDKLWSCEWKLVEHYRALGNTAKALARIDHAIAASEKISPLLKLRLVWLKATIAERAGLHSDALRHCEEIAKMARAVPPEQRREAGEIAANTLLLKASCLEIGMSGSGMKGAISTYEQIRALYPSSEAAPLSYLYQARAEAALGRYASAQKLCGELASRAGDPRYKYSARFDAAEYAKKIGTNAAYREALAMFDSLCADFPGDPRNFYARLWQADILRLLNSFADARKLYEEIVNKYQGHPEIHLAWLRLGDSILARQSKAPDAVGIYERLYSLPDVPAAAKAEAAFKWSFALRRAGRVSEANEVAWLTSSALMKAPPDEAALYWIGRGMYNLALSLEELGNKNDASRAYRMIVEYKLPSHKMAAQKLEISKQK